MVSEKIGIRLAIDVEARDGQGSTASRLTWDAGIFAAVFLVYLLSPLRSSVDSSFVLPRAYSLLHGDGGALDAMVMADPATHGVTLAPNGQIHSMYPVGPSLLALPVVAVLDLIVPDLRASLLDRTTAVEIEAFLAALISAMSAVLMWRQARRATRRVGVALLAVMIFAFASPMWSTASRGLCQHGPLVLLTLGAWLALRRAGDEGHATRRWLLVAGLLAAFTVVTRPLGVAFVLVASIHAIVVHRRDAIVFLSAGAAVAACWIVFNWLTEGQFVSPYYLPGTFPIRGGAWYERVFGQLISPSRGLLIFSPIFLLAFIGPLSKWRGGTLDRHDGLAIGATISLLFVHLGSSAWWAGHSYGPRFMTDAVPFLVYLCIDPLERLAAMPRSWTRTGLRAAVTGLVLISVAMHLNGATNRNLETWNQKPRSIGDPSEYHRLWDWRHPQFLQGPIELPPNRLCQALSRLGSPPRPRSARIAMFFDPEPFRPGFIWRMRAVDGLAVPLPWTLQEIADLGGRVRIDVVAWSDDMGPHVLAIWAAGHEIARWRVRADGRMASYEIALPIEAVTSEESGAPLRVVVDDTPGLLKVAISNARGEP